MKIDSLKLYSFRNYEYFECDFDAGVNLILGENAQGKTNLLEAVSYLSAGRSFRTRKEKEIIRFGDEFCDLQASVTNEERTQTIRAVLFQGRKPRQVFLNGVKQKNASAWKGTLRTVMFCPEDLLVLKTGASGRRKLLDDALCQLRPAYDQALEEYDRLLEHKSRILKEYRENPSLLDILPEFNEQLAKYGAVIIAARAGYVRELARHASVYHGDFSGGRETLNIEYQTVSNIEDPFVPKQQLYELLREHQRTHRAAELESGQCLSGPHKDDINVLLGGIPIKNFGSQGQIRTAAISLKLAEREIFRVDTGSEPVLLLDDVLSELDEGRQNFILNQIRSGQVFITCCETDRMTDIGKVILIEKGKLCTGQ